MAPEVSEEQSQRALQVARPRRGPEPSKEERALVSASSSLPAICLALYACIRLGTRLFHTSRRIFLRTLLVDLVLALDSLRVQYFLDFGALLGIHR